MTARRRRPHPAHGQRRAAAATSGVAFGAMVLGFAASARAEEAAKVERMRQQTVDAARTAPVSTTTLDLHGGATPATTTPSTTEVPPTTAAPAPVATDAPVPTTTARQVGRTPGTVPPATVPEPEPTAPPTVPPTTTRATAPLPDTPVNPPTVPPTTAPPTTTAPPPTTTISDAS